MWILIALACSPTPVDQDPVDTGWFGDGRLQIGRHLVCVDDFCADQWADETRAAAEEAFGEPASCEETDDLSSCSWPTQGIELSWADPGEDPATDLSISVTLTAPYSGSTDHGLGVGTPEDCLPPTIESAPAPDLMEATEDGWWWSHHCDGWGWSSHGRVFVEDGEVVSLRLSNSMCDP